jgi:Iap family predicted aminopeptidase
LVRFMPKPARATGLEALASRLRADVEQLAEPRHMGAQPKANAQTRARLAARLRALGYVVHEQGEHCNLVALPASRAASKVSLPAVAAHYDSVPTTPGADDNASALAVMLEVASQAAARGRPLALLAFNGEEDGMLGSAEFVDARAAWPANYNVELEAVHVLEMLGYTGDAQRLPPGGDQLLASFGVPIPERGDFLLLAANPDSAAMLASILAAADSCVHTPSLLAIRLAAGGEQLFPDITRSDHAPFWRAGLPAMMWTDTAELRNPNYHLPSDTPDTLDYEFMARVCSLLLASLGLG